jgi:transposase
MFTAGVLIMNDNARPHASGAVSEILEKYGWQVLHFDLFPKTEETTPWEMLQKH